MKKLILIFLIIAVSSIGGCKVNRSIQRVKSDFNVVKIDSARVTQKSLTKDSSKSDFNIKKKDLVTEEYTETNITIKTADNNVIRVPGIMRSDSSSNLDSIKYTNGETPATILNIFMPSKQAKESVAQLTTPQGIKTFNNWTSITISTKNYKKTSERGSDSSGSSIVSKILKNSIDSSSFHSDSTSNKQESKDLNVIKKPSLFSIFAAFWWIPITLILIIFIAYKNGSIWNWIKKIFKKK